MADTHETARIQRAVHDIEPHIIELRRHFVGHGCLGRRAVPDRQRCVKKAVPIRKKHPVLPPVSFRKRISAFRKQGGDPLPAFIEQIPIL